MNCLIMLLLNTATTKYHPIFYMEKPFPGGIDAKITRFQSQGHHTEGFLDHHQALAECQDIRDRLQGMGLNIIMDINDVLPWDGEDVPADTQVRIIK